MDQRIGVVPVTQVLHQLPRILVLAQLPESSAARFSGVSLVTTTSLTSAAGAWSHMPMHDVQSSEKRPSSVVSPNSIPSSSDQGLGNRVRPLQLVDHVAGQPDRDSSPWASWKKRRRTSPHLRPARAESPAPLRSCRSPRRRHIGVRVWTACKTSIKREGSFCTAVQACWMVESRRLFMKLPFGLRGCRAAE